MSYEMLRMIFMLKKIFGGTVAHAYDPSSEEAEDRGLLKARPTQATL